MAPFFFPRDRNDFDVAIICALQIESDAVEAMFDEIWEGQNDFGKATNDQNTYTTGRIGSHNVVLAYMPGMGKVASASVAISSLHSFPNITLGLVVGICAAIPKSKTKEEIILGDVVISTGVEQFDFGRRLTTGFKAKNTVGDRLGRSTPQIRSFLKKLGGRHWLKILGEDTVKYLQNLHQEEGFEAWHYPGVQADNLYPPDYLHKHKIGTCTCHEDDSTICDEARDVICAELQCDKEQAIQRSRLQDFAAMWGAPGTEMGPTPLIHFGPIASGDQTIRDATYRDQLARQNGVIAFEMEGAGAWDNFPTVVIKGVCDYADSHKNKTWHPYAAAVAAACMKAFLKQWNVSGFRELTPSSTLEPEVKIELAPVPEPPLIPQNHLLIETFRQYGTRSIPEIQWDLLIRAALYIIAVFALILPWMPDGRIKSDLTMHQTQELHPEYPIFAVIGKTGVGKSSFINVLGGRNYSADAPEICHGLETCTNDVMMYKAEIDNSPIYLMDTPGFDDSRMSDKEVMEMIYLKLEDLYRGDKLVKGLIYLHDITQPRVGGLDARQFRAFEQLLGVDKFQNIAFVVTKWLERPSEREVQIELAKEEELKYNYWNKMIRRGSLVMRHDGSANSAKLIVMSLIYKPKIKLVMPHEEVQEKLDTLYKDIASPAKEEDHSRKEKVDDVIPGSAFIPPKRSTLLKVAWSATRLFPALIFFLATAGFVNEGKPDQSFSRTIMGWLMICASVAWSIGLLYRKPIMSASVILVDLASLFFGTACFGDSGKQTHDSSLYWITFVLSIIGLPMTYFWWLHWPHTSDMYFI